MRRRQLDFLYAYRWHLDASNENCYWTELSDNSSANSRQAAVAA
jgi:hypothetical protein